MYSLSSWSDLELDDTVKCWARLKHEQKMSQILHEKNEEELKECTFQPVTRWKQNKTRDTPMSDISSSYLNCSKPQKSNDNFYNAQISFMKRWDSKVQKLK